LLWQSGWGYILPGWPICGYLRTGPQCPPTHPCLSLQHLCCNSLCAGGLGSVCYIWRNYPALSEFKYALSKSLSPLGPCFRTTWPDNTWLSPVHLVMLLLQFQLFCLWLGNPDLFTGCATWTCCFRLSLYRTCTLDLCMTSTPEALTCCTFYNNGLSFDPAGPL
jgi:hypothetical protein